MNEQQALERVRALCANLPQVSETKTYGHPTFQAKKKTFAVLDDHEQKDMLCLVFKADPGEQATLVDGERFFPSKFGAKHGWTAMRVDGRTNWTLARKLIDGSFRRVMPSAAKPSTRARR